MNEEKHILFDLHDDFVCITFEGGAYYYTVGNGEVKGPFFEEHEAYQECLREVTYSLNHALNLLLDLSSKAQSIIKTIIGEEYGND